MSTQSKLDHYHKQIRVKIFKNLFFVCQKNKCITFFLLINEQDIKIDVILTIQSRC